MARKVFEEQLDRHFGQGHANKEAVLVLGVNDFQTLNGLAGHETGDRVLQEIARRMVGFSTDHGHVARLGGDVFGLLVGEVGRTPAESIEARISAIIEACERSVQVGGKSYECEVSAGVAVQNQQFQLYYQPQFDRLRQCTGYEALLRWHHPVLGVVSPAEFIQLAEEVGLIVRIGDWVLEQAVVT